MINNKTLVAKCPPKHFKISLKTYFNDPLENDKVHLNLTCQLLKTDHLVDMDICILVFWDCYVTMTTW